MKKLNENDMKILIENILTNVLIKENTATLGIVAQYENNFRIVQSQYNNFWEVGEISYAKFYDIQMRTEQLKNEFEVKSNKILSTISDKNTTTEDEYYNNLEKYKEIENEISALSKKIDFFSSEINSVAEVLKNYDNIEYTLNIF